MENTKGLHIVILQALAFDSDEFMRVKAGMRTLSGQEIRPLFEKATTTLFLINAPYKELVKEIDLARDPSTNVFIGRLSEPCTTIGLLPWRAILQANNLYPRQK